jgi:hypothetical protein
MTPRTAAYALALVIALAIACDLLLMPVQVSDSLGEIIDASHSPSAWASFTGSFGNAGYLRPMRIAQIKAFYDLAGNEHYWLVYRGFHALLLVAAVMLFTRALRVSTVTDFGAASVALAVLIGLHTFRGTVQEAFPINHFLEVLVFCLIALNLAQARRGWWIDVTAVVAFAVAALTLESGLLVWVVAVSAWAVGWRGMSKGALAAMTVCLLGYLYVRFVALGTGVPTLSERSSGYWLEVLEPSELQQRFGAAPLRFYLYNVAASVSSVLFSEPQSGVFVAVSDWIDQRVFPRVTIPLATSLVTTAALVWTAARRRWRQPFDDTARLLVVFAAVLFANASLSFAYTKDEVMSTAGAFYALAVFGVVRDMLMPATPAVPHRGGVSAGNTAWPYTFAVVLLLTATAVGWSIRGAGVHYVLRSQAFKHQIDWVALTVERQGQGEWPVDGGDQAIIQRLRRDAVGLVLPNTRQSDPEWVGRVWRD